MISRQHHFVSQCYLKSFSDQHSKTPKAFVFDLVTKRCHPQSIKNVAVKRDFNIIIRDGQPSDELERALASFEGELGPALQRVIEKKSLDHKDDKATLLNFICHVTLRNPRWRNRVEEFEAKVLKAATGLALSTPERWASQVERMREAGVWHENSAVDYHDLKKFFDADEYDLRFSEEHHSEREFAVFDKALPTFFHRQWTVLVAGHNSGGFITSDHPACLVWSASAKAPPLYGPGLGLPQTELIFPLSPDIALVGTFEGSGGTVVADEFLVSLLNEIVAAQAERQIVTRNKRFLFACPAPDIFGVGEQIFTDGRFIRPRPDRRA